MRPFLVNQNSLNFSGSGLGTFQYCTSCNVVENLNGTFELHMTLLQNEPLYENLEIGAIIVAMPNMTDEYQPFVIEQMQKNIRGEIEIYATHIAQYRSKLIPIAPFTATSLADALTKIAANSLETNIFTFTTNKTVNSGYTLKTPRSLRAVMGGEEGSLLDIYGGEYYFDKLRIQLLTRRGKDNIFRVVYGKNMVDFNQTDEFDWTHSITGIIPYYADEDNVVVGSIQYSQYADSYPYKKTIPYDFSEKFEDTVPTSAELNALAVQYLAEKGLPIISIEAKFEDISTLPMYSDLYSNISSLQLGDSVRVINSQYGTNVKTRIRQTDFDVLNERYNALTIGDSMQSINDAIADTVDSRTISGGGGETAFDLLWTNEDATINFGANTVQVDLSGYDMVYVLFNRTTSSNSYKSSVLLAKDYNVAAIGLYSSKLIMRGATASDTGVAFSGGNYYDTYGTATSNNSYMIPYKIYGLKIANGNSPTVPVITQVLNTLEIT